MIPIIGLLKYDKFRNLDLKITRFINDQILKMLIVIQDSTQLCDEINPYRIVPQGCLRNKSFSYERKIEEIYNILKSDIVRKDNLSLSLLNQYIIFQIIDTYIEFEYDDDVFSEIPNELKEEILNCPEYWVDDRLDENHERHNFVIESICDYRCYLDFLFDDWDFMEEVPSYVLNWTMNKDGTDMDQLKCVEEFLPMVPDDIYESYQKQYRRYSEMEEQRHEQSIGKIVVSGDNNILVGAGSVNNCKHHDKQKTSYWQKYGIPTIIAACIGLLGTILTILFAK